MDQYTQLPRKLGKGSFGTVALVQRKSDGQLFAMKMIDVESDNVPQNPYDNEHAILKKLQHPNIIKVFETWTNNENLCIVMEYCENGDLQQKVKEAKANNSYIPEEQILEWFCQLCLAVKYLHDNHVIHRDIKVHNIFLSSNGLVKLGDFGISKQLENTTDLSQTHTGTPLYLTPEMILHSTSSYKSDIWMLGCLLHELCSLQKPFKGDNFAEVIQQIIKADPAPIPEHYSPSLQKLVTLLLEKDLDKRPSIYSLLAMPEIFKQTQLLKLKYPEIYNTRFMFGQDLRKAEKDPRKTAVLDSEVFPLSKCHSNPTAGSKSAVPNFAQQSTFALQVDSAQPHTSQHRPSLKDISDKPSEFKLENKSLLSPATRRSNNIWSLVQQKKDSQNHPQRPVIAKRQQDSPVIGPQEAEPQKSLPTTTISVTKPVKSFEEEQLKKAANASNKKANTADKEGNSTRKTHRLSIRIPGASPDQSQGKEIKGSGDTARETQKDGLNGATRDHSNDSNSNVASTVKTVTKKEFTFSNLIFDNKSPVSPSRSMWVPQFLKSKLGNSVYEQVLEFLAKSGNPLGILKDQPELVLEIIGENNRDCLLMLSFMMAYNSNSATPTSGKNADWEKNKEKIQVKSPAGAKKLFMRMPKKITPQKDGVLDGNNGELANEKKCLIVEEKK